MRGSRGSCLCTSSAGCMQPRRPACKLMQQPAAGAAPRRMPVLTAGFACHSRSTTGPWAAQLVAWQAAER